MKFIQRWVYSFAITSVALIFFNLFVILRFGVNLGYIRVAIGALIISVLVASSITLFKMKKGNDILKAVLGILPLLPITLVLRNMYGVAVFRASVFLWILAAIFVVAYSLAVVIVSSKAKKEEKELNTLLKDKTKDEQK